jgi:hypothetical protein
MNDYQIGKRMAEEMNLEAFTEAFPLATGRTIEIVDSGESPDFEALLDGTLVGLELTEIRNHDYPDDYLSEVFRLASQKSASFQRHERFKPRPIALLCYLIVCRSMMSATS